MSSTFRHTRTRPFRFPLDTKKQSHHGEDGSLRLRQFNGGWQLGFAANLLRTCLSIGTIYLIGRGDENREQTSTESSPTCHRKIQLALGLSFKERRGRVRTASPVKAQQDVIMAVKDRNALRRCHQDGPASFPTLPPPSSLLLKFHAFL